MKKIWLICICLVSWSHAMVIIQLRDSSRNSHAYQFEIEPSKKHAKALLIYLVTANIVKILRDNCLDSAKQEEDDNQQAFTDIDLKQYAFNFLAGRAVGWIAKKLIDRCIQEQDDQGTPEDDQQSLALIVQKTVEYLVPDEPEEDQCAMILNAGRSLLTEQLSKDILAWFAAPKNK